MIHHLSRQLFQISTLDRIVFANDVEGSEKRLMPASYVALNAYHQVLEEKRISSTTFMENNQRIHQESGTSNFKNITSNPGLLLPKPTLWFQLSWGDLIIIPLIMVMLRFTLKSFQLNITLNLFQIQKPLLSNQLMTMKLTISRNSSTNNMMNIFWMLTSR